MANHPSALKRHRQSELAREANRSTKSRVRTLVRKVQEAVEAGDKPAAQASLKQAEKALAKAASKGVVHPRNASRRTGRLAHAVSQISEG